MSGLGCSASICLSSGVSMESASLRASSLRRWTVAGPAGVPGLSARGAVAWVYGVLNASAHNLCECGAQAGIKDLSGADCGDYLCSSIQLSKVSLERPSPVSKSPPATSRECSGSIPPELTPLQSGECYPRVWGDVPETLQHRQGLRGGWGRGECLASGSWNAQGSGPPPSHKGILLHCSSGPQCARLYNGMLAESA